MERITRTFAFIMALTFGTLAAAQPVDINTADSQALAASLNGVGEAKARAIVAYREAPGPFGSAEELTQVNGIGGHIVEMNRDSISVGSGTSR